MFGRIYDPSNHILAEVDFDMPTSDFERILREVHAHLAGAKRLWRRDSFEDALVSCDDRITYHTPDRTYRFTTTPSVTSLTLVSE